MQHLTLNQIPRMAVSMVLALCSIACPAQEEELDSLMRANDLREFDLSKLPMLQFFDNPYVVSRRGDKLIVTRAWPDERTSELELGAKAYFWESRGEFGGKLQLRSKGTVIDVLEGNIVDLLPIGNEIFVVSGLTHLGMASGSVHLISEQSKPTETTFVTNLPDAPVRVYLDLARKDHPIKVLVGSKSVMALDLYNSLDVLYWDAFWAFGLEPTSIVRYRDHYLIGLPHGIAAVPAPWGPTSQYCRNDSVYLPRNSCTPVRFYADETFRSEIRRRLPLDTRPAD